MWLPSDLARREPGLPYSLELWLCWIPYLGRMQGALTSGCSYSPKRGSKGQGFLFSLKVVWGGKTPALVMETPPLPGRHFSGSHHCVISPSFKMDTCQYALLCPSLVTGAQIAEGQRGQAHSQQVLARKDGTLKLAH